MFFFLFYVSTSFSNSPLSFPEKSIFKCFLYFCVGAKQEHWLTTTVEKERSREKDQIMEKYKNIKIFRYLKEKTLVLEQCVQLIESFELRTYIKIDVRDVRLMRIKISLAKCYRETGRADKAKYLLGTFLFQLNMEEDEKKLELDDQSRYSTLLYSTLLYSTLLYSTLLYSTLLSSLLLFSSLLISPLLFLSLLFLSLLFLSLLFSSNTFYFDIILLTVMLLLHSSSPFLIIY